ncbi:permease-like cell division protein FtsX [Alloalcanivorax xenomutans]|jgi:cell division transport system permease protein|uniref:permease-like cell division protein FtsX n=1 Tax=Alloalcanivorax xenomutans TaxID=1094342 RepID=UPI00047AD64C|nr:permease-like cell division protein FtsX [Alloalcanivorax xenomutans]MCE7525040.1 permease-like cell division protein FtsX [Alloalcanivorax xenomutans]WOD28674.1 permease-like cell division protein FtsX [Alloalcanivorax xenomutans]CUR45075.1 Cell division protein FtsX [Alloalcanivorax xenomutans]SOC08338.1 cell division transport system permease protein [Alloalcanivorax xenomutans]
MARNPKRPAGARSARTSLGDHFTAWRHHHRDSLADALGRMRGTPGSTLLTILVIAIALALPTGLSVLLDNARVITQGWDGRAHLSVFLKMDVNEERQRALAKDWAALDGVADTEVITRQQALDEFREQSGFGDVLEALPDNPLPPLIVVFPSNNEPAALEALQQRLSKLPEVDLAQLDVAWVRRLHAIIELGQRLIGVLTLALAAAVVLVVVNTVRLAIESRREEIVVIKIVGGTDGFVRRPFLYSGFCCGFAGGLGALILVGTALWWLGGPVNQLLDLYKSEHSLTGMSPATALILPLFSGALGLLGAWLAVSRHLGEIEPQF